MPRRKDRVANCAATVAVAVAVVVGLAHLASPTLAQAGSTGGTIGNADKSVSGGEVIRSRHHVRQVERRSERHEMVRGKDTVCVKFIGLWRGALGGDMIFKPGGIVVGEHPTNSGSWSCRDSQLNVTWRSSEIDSCALSADASLQTCKNAMGYSFVRTRESGSLILP